MASRQRRITISRAIVSEYIISPVACVLCISFPSLSLSHSPSVPSVDVAQLAVPQALSNEVLFIYLFTEKERDRMRAANRIC